MSHKSSAVGVVYSDASDSGFGGYFVRCGLDLVSDVWSHEQMRTSSTFREILAVKFFLLSLVNQLSGLTVKWFTDNQNITRLGVVKSICSPKLALYLVSAVIMVFPSKWNGSQNPRMNRLIFSVVFLIQTIGAFLHFRFTTLTQFGVLIL